MSIQISESALRLVDGANYAVLATVNPDGSPQTSVVWVGRDGGDLLFSTVEGRVNHPDMVLDALVRGSTSAVRTLMAHDLVDESGWSVRTWRRRGPAVACF